MAGWAEPWAAGPIRFVYESGPRGFQPCRDLGGPGRACGIVAISNIPKRTDDRALEGAFFGTELEGLRGRGYLLIV